MRGIYGPGWSSLPQWQSPQGLEAGDLAVYNRIYIVPLAAIVFILTWTLGSHKLSEREGRLLKLVSGLMMLGLGIVLVFHTRVSEQRTGSVGVVSFSDRWRRLGRHAPTLRTRAEMTLHILARGARLASCEEHEKQEPIQTTSSADQMYWRIKE